MPPSSGPGDDPTNLSTAATASLHRRPGRLYKGAILTRRKDDGAPVACETT